MTEEELAVLRRLSFPARAEIEENDRYTLSARARDFWRELGEKYGFRWRTARPGVGTQSDEQVFYAARRNNGKQ